MVFTLLFAVLGAVFVGTGLVAFLFYPRTPVSTESIIIKFVWWHPLTGAFIGAVVGALFGLIFDVSAFITRTKDNRPTKAQTTV